MVAFSALMERLIVADVAVQLDEFARVMLWVSVTLCAPGVILAAETVTLNCPVVGVPDVILL